MIIYFIFYVNKYPCQNLFEFEFIHQFILLINSYNFDGIIDRPSWARAIVGTRYEYRSKVESDLLTVRLFNHHPCLIFPCAREAPFIVTPRTSLFHSRPPWDARSTKKGKGGGGEEGKGGKMKWSLYEIRFPKRQCRRHRFTSDIRSSSSVSCAIDSSDFCLVHSRDTHAPTSPRVCR